MIRFEMDPELTDELIGELVTLHRIGWPASLCSTDRMWDLLTFTRHHLAVAWDESGQVVGMAQLIETDSFRRTALLYEELIVAPKARTAYPMLVWDLDAFILGWARDHYPSGTRIEGTVDDMNTPLWVIHRRSGFDDRRQRAFVVTL